MGTAAKRRRRGGRRSVHLPTPRPWRRRHGRPTFRNVHPDMIEIPGGDFTMGTSAEDVERLAAEAGYHPSRLAAESPERRVHSDGFWIDPVPVTNRRYRDFVGSAGHPAPQSWNGGDPPAELLDHP